MRVQLLVPSTGGRAQRIALYRRPRGPFAAFEGREILVARGAGTASDSGGGTSDASAVGQALGGATGELVAGGGDPIEGPEVLVCTHGRRDRCCGSLGTQLWQELAADPGAVGGRRARTSHTGGHRFAPTGIVLPVGTVWGFLDREALGGIVTRTGPLDDVLPRYRGCSGLDSPAIQAVEREVLREVGWSLFDRSRHGEELGEGRVRLTVNGSGAPAVYEATVSPGRTLPVPDCGQPLDLAKKSETEQRVLDLVQVA